MTWDQLKTQIKNTDYKELEKEQGFNSQNLSQEEAELLQKSIQKDGQNKQVQDQFLGIRR